MGAFRRDSYGKLSLSASFMVARSRIFVVRTDMRHRATDAATAWPLGTRGEAKDRFCQHESAETHGEVGRCNPADRPVQELGFHAHPPRRHNIADMSPGALAVRKIQCPDKRRVVETRRDDHKYPAVTELRLGKPPIAARLLNNKFSSPLVGSRQPLWP
jgi:hypothetical protein